MKHIFLRIDANFSKTSISIEPGVEVEVTIAQNN